MTAQPRPFDPATRLPELMTALDDAGVPVIVLRAPASFAHADRCLPSVTRLQIDLLIPRGSRRAARRVFVGTDWRFELGGRGVWRAIPKVSYLWDDLVGIDLLWAVPGAPFAVVRARRLERRLWARAEVGDGSGAPRFADPEDLLLFGAVQASRPGRPQRFEAEDLAAFAEGKDVGGVARAAREVGLEAAVALGFRAAGLAEQGRSRTPSWTVAGVAWRLLRPRRLRGPLLTGTPRLGRAITRSRFAGGEFLSGYGVFLPRPITESLAAGALDATRDRRRPLIVDVGTGCGAVALAIAAGHPDARVHAVDTSTRALWWARINRPISLIGRVRFHRGSLLRPLPRRFRGRVQVITANVPYVPPRLWGEGWTSRAGTVVGQGEDGLGLYRSLIGQARAYLEPGGRLVLQIGREQWDSFRAELEAVGYRRGEELSGTAGDLVAWVTWGGDQ